MTAVGHHTCMDVDLLHPLGVGAAMYFIYIYKKDARGLFILPSVSIITETEMCFFNCIVYNNLNKYMYTNTNSNTSTSAQHIYTLISSWLIDDRLYRAILWSALLSTHCTCMWLYMSDQLYSVFLDIHQSGVYSAGMASATWNCSRLGASPVHTIQPCTMSLHAKPHMWGACVFSCNLPLALLAEWPGSFTCYCGNTGVTEIAHFQPSGGGRRGKLYPSYHYTVTTRMIPALRWAAVRAILMFHWLWWVKSQDSVHGPQL